MTKMMRLNFDNHIGVKLITKSFSKVKDINLSENWYNMAIELVKRYHKINFSKQNIVTIQSINNLTIDYLCCYILDLQIKNIFEAIKNGERKKYIKIKDVDVFVEEPESKELAIKYFVLLNFNELSKIKGLNYLPLYKGSYTKSLEKAIENIRKNISYINKEYLAHYVLSLPVYKEYYSDIKIETKTDVLPIVKFLKTFFPEYIPSDENDLLDCVKEIDKIDFDEHIGYYSKIIKILDIENYPGNNLHDKVKNIIIYYIQEIKSNIIARMMMETRFDSEKTNIIFTYEDWTPFYQIYKNIDYHEYN